MNEMISDIKNKTRETNPGLLKYLNEMPMMIL